MCSGPPQHERRELDEETGRFSFPALESKGGAWPVVREEFLLPWSQDVFQLHHLVVACLPSAAAGLKALWPPQQRQPPPWAEA